MQKLTTPNLAPNHARQITSDMAENKKAVKTSGDITDQDLPNHKA